MENDCLNRAWPFELADLAPDPSLYRGRLSNGFRYVIKENHHPQDRVAIYLNVRAGSLKESEQQQGAAHFLEHMMFNGTTHFPAGKLIEYFHSVGMDFGADTNAHTGYDETVYRIILPEGSLTNLNGAFQVFRDFAERALLGKAEIEQERGVVFAEKRARDTARYRAYKSLQTFKLRGTLFPQRLPIGLEKTLETINHELLKSYYHSWYRPDNMDLVVVGAVNMEKTEELIKSHFNSFQAVSPIPACPDTGELIHKGTEYYHQYEPEIGYVTVGLESLWDMEPENDSLYFEQGELHKLIGAMAMRYRLEREMEKSSFLLIDPSFYASDILSRVGFARLSADTDADNWKETLDFLVKQLRLALDYGFVDEEIERAKSEIVSYFNEKVQTAASMDSRVLARRIIEHLNNNRVYQSPHQEQELYTPLLEKINTAEINSAFRELWGHDSRLISVSGNLELGTRAREHIVEVYEKAQARELAKLERSEITEFPYLLPDPAPSHKFTSVVHSDIGVETITYANGLVLNLKQTDFDKNKFYLIANWGGGQQKEVEKGASLILPEVVNDSGTSKLLKSTVDRLLAESSVHLRFNVNLSSFSWRGSALTKDFNEFCQFLYTFLLDSAARETVFNRVMNDTELLYKNLNHSIEAAVALKVKPYLGNFVSGFGLPDWSVVASNDFDKLTNYLELVRKLKGLEISVVGDFDKHQVINTIAHYFSGLEIGQFKNNEPQELPFPQGGKLRVEVETVDDKALIVIAWPTVDKSNIDQVRRLYLLAKVFEERLYNRVREKLGATYSPNAVSYNSRVHKNYGYLSSQVIVDPKDQDLIISEILSISNTLARSGVTEEELSWSKKPILTSLKESLESNSYWLSSVMSLSSRYPEQLEWPKTIFRDFDSITAEELNILAQEYFNNEKAAVVRIVPIYSQSN